MTEADMAATEAEDEASMGWVLECEKALDAMRLVRDSAAGEAAKGLSRAVVNRGAGTLIDALDALSEDDLPPSEDLSLAFLHGLVDLLSRVTNLERACASLLRFGGTPHGACLLAGALLAPGGFLKQALASYPSPVRLLLIRQVKRVVGTRGLKDGKAVPLLREVAERFVGEEDVGVVEAAGECFEGAAWGARDDPEVLREVFGLLCELLGGPAGAAAGWDGSNWDGSTVRVVHALAKMAVASDHAFAAFAKCGVLGGIASALSAQEGAGDELLTINLMELVLAMVEGMAEVKDRATVGRHLLTPLADPLGRLARSESTMLVMTRCHAMRLLASLQSLCCSGGKEELGTAPFELLATCMLSALEEARDRELVRSTLDAMVGFALSRAGLGALLADPAGKDLASRLVAFALDRDASGCDDDIQEQALVILARFVQRAGEGLLKPVIFSTLRGSKTLAEAFHTALSNPEENLRCAAYECLEVVARSAWGAAEICTREKLVQRVSDASVEAEPSAASWRHKCACSLLATARSIAEGEAAADARVVEIVTPLVPTLQAAVKAGPYGSGGQARVESEAV